VKSLVHSTNFHHMEEEAEEVEEAPCFHGKGTSNMDHCTLACLRSEHLVLLLLECFVLWLQTCFQPLFRGQICGSVGSG